MSISAPVFNTLLSIAIFYCIIVIHGSKFLLIIQDYSALSNQEAVTVAEVLVQEFVAISFWGPHVPQGKNFESSIFKGICSLLGVEKTQTTPFHLHSDRMVESF